MLASASNNQPETQQGPLAFVTFSDSDEEWSGRFAQSKVLAAGGRRPVLIFAKLVLSHAVRYAPALQQHSKESRTFRPYGFAAFQELSFRAKPRDLRFGRRGRM